MNFQPAAAATPAGYSADSGAPFSSQRTYGWVREDSLSSPTHVPLDIQTRSRDRGNVVADPRLNTLVHINLSGEPSGAWEAAVPNGNYTVTVGSGDPSYFDSVPQVRVEGALALSWTATSIDRQRVTTVGVTVNDGRLTLDGIGGTNTKFNFVDITTTPPPSSLSERYTFGPVGSAAYTGYTTDSGAAFNPTTGYGWVRQDSLSGVHQPLNLLGNARERNAIPDQRLDTFIHMQFSGSGGIATPGAWERTVANGSYDVTVGVGDPTYFDSSNSINIEGTAAVNNFAPVAGSRFRFVSRTVTVTDGRLTIDAIGGTNTKLDYITIDAAPEPPAGKQRPTADGPRPLNGSVGVDRDTAVSSETTLPNVGAGVDKTTLTPSSVRVERVSDGQTVPGSRNTSGGGDVINFQATSLLEKNTEYRVSITNAVKDTSGAPFKPLTWTFTTNAKDPGVNTNTGFIKIPQANTGGKLYASLVIGPDNRLYVSTLGGQIDRFPINADGSLGTPTLITTVFEHEGGERHILGLAFDPASTVSNPILWVSHSYPAIENSPDWTGKISRLSGPNLGTIQDVVTQLPRSVNDHETNSLAFGPDGKLYVTQGSNSAAGAPDTQWGNRPERELNAAVLKIDLAKITSPPLSVKTEEGGTYDPFAANAPVSIYASGVRNAYDLVWHSNGQLYSAVNGTAGHGNTPATPTTLPTACQRRIDAATRGNWTGPAVAAQLDIVEQPDLLLRIEQGGYYGHPNPSRCEYTFFGGNPTAAADPLQLASYPVGTPPDRNYKPASYSFGVHYSPDGMIEYQSNAFGGALKGRLLVARYSGGKDIVALDINPVTKEIAGQQATIPGLSGLLDPLDLIEDTRNGNLYVTEFGGARVSLLKPDPSVVGTTPPPTSPPPTSPQPTTPGPGGVGSNLYRINAGSDVPFTDTTGKVWRADTGLFTPATAGLNGPVGDPIALTEDDALYAASRGNTGNATPISARTLKYALPTTATKVDVRLLFAERYWTAAGKRLFNVAIEGQPKLTNYDLVVAAGGRDRARDERFTGIDVSGGVLNIDLSTIKDFPALSGIEVTCAAGC